MLKNYIKKIKKQIKTKSKIRGFIDGIDGLHIVGWAYDPEEPGKRLEVVIYVDGEPLAFGVADQYREDLEKAGIGDGRHGFRIELPQSFLKKYGGTSKEFYLQVGNIVVSSEEVQVPEVNSKIQGYLDGIDEPYAFGWA